MSLAAVSTTAAEAPLGAARSDGLQRSRRALPDALDRWSDEVDAVILRKQNPATGLIPASVAVTTHGDYTHAWTRDNVYSILAVWGLALAYRRVAGADNNSFEGGRASQMTASGLLIIQTKDEVHFIQNLVYYIERAYRTPDYGIWERGNKINHGQPELNSSSIGMAVAALQAINGLNLFGARGGASSKLYDTTLRSAT
ncbi:hypothetical protein HK405_002005 [Cladochytrium tenue]|nr:hypothetical protein HK405_002005 [Cladochytrium tenue]